MVSANKKVTLLIILAPSLAYDKFTVIPLSIPTIDWIEGGLGFEDAYTDKRLE